MRGMTPRILAVLTLTLFAPAAPAGAQQVTDQALRADIRQLMEVTGASDLATAAASGFTKAFRDQIKQTQTGVPDQTIDAISRIVDEEMKKRIDGPDGLMEQVVFIYSKHFTRADIRALLEFYSTDIGKKLLAEQPRMLEETMQVVGTKLQREMPMIVKTVQDRMKAEGLLP